MRRVTLFFALFVGDHVGLFPTFNSHSSYKLAAYLSQTQETQRQTKEFKI